MQTSTGGVKKVVGFPVLRVKETSSMQILPSEPKC